MKLLYVATDQQIPGSTGGSVHVMEVARGLARRGHEVHVVARPGREERSQTDTDFQLHPARTLLPHRVFRWTAQKMIGRLIDRLGIEIVLERYYNFAGEGVRAAHRRGLPTVLEVNSPIVDHPGSLKAWLDRFVLFGLTRKLREGQCRQAAALVTPLPAIIPPAIPKEKVYPIHWGANVERFRPGLTPRGPAAALPIPTGARVVVFSSSFRPWHGAELLARAAAEVLSRAQGDNAFFLFLGSGPELPELRRLVDRLGIGSRAHLTGAVPYEHMPFYLARSHIGVAPYQPSRHGQLQLGFYWSPLKIFEYMASELPVVTLDVEPLNHIIRPGREGLLVTEDDVEGLANAITELVASPEQASAMGKSGRERIVSHYSWQVHCEQLEELFEELAQSHLGTET